MTVSTEPIPRYGEVPRAVMEAMEHVDTVVWMWPVFITFTTSMMERAKQRGQRRETSGTQLQEQRQRPFHVYFEAGPGVLACDHPGAEYPAARRCGCAGTVDRPAGGAGAVGCVTELPRDFRTGKPVIIYAAACISSSSSMTSCGVL